jgi:hypothetical protein
MRGNRYKGISLLMAGLVCMGGCFRQVKPIEDYFKKGTNRGTTVKQYIRYGSFDIWEHFQMSERYMFGIKDLRDKDNLGDVGITITVINRDEKTLHMIVEKDIAEQKEKWKKDEAPYMKFEKKKELTIQGNSAQLVHCEGSIEEKGSRYFNESIEMYETCFIVISGNRVLKIKLDSFVHLYKPVKHLWEEFYTSFRTDHSQAYKITYGSFKLVDFLVEDSSTLEYKMPKVDYNITVGYLDEDSAKEARGKTPYPSSWKVLTSGMFKGVDIKERAKETLIVDGKKARYLEYELIDTEKGKSRTDMFFQILDDVKPALEINVSAETKAFEFYRAEMEFMLKSLKFDQ